MINNRSMNLPHPIVVLSGCGTSGRLAFQTVRRYNRILSSIGQEPFLRYTIAGGDSAILYR